MLASLPGIVTVRCSTVMQARVRSFAHVPEDGLREGGVAHVWYRRSSNAANLLSVRVKDVKRPGARPKIPWAQVVPEVRSHPESDLHVGHLCRRNMPDVQPLACSGCSRTLQQNM